MLKALDRFLTGTDDPQQYGHERFDPARPIGRNEQIRRFGSALNALYWQAEYARRELAISYRHFCVGCAVWAFREDASLYTDRWRWFYGMNTKIRQDSRNICAEPIALGSALARRSTEVIGVVVVGLTQEDERGKTTPTLRPCKECRLFMRNLPIVTPDTIIVTAHPPPEGIDDIRETTHEVHSFHELSALYDEN